ncbi:hypothetical protein CI610_02601 [invertebrate metagenome]|uniref:Uncharacterized protein n=1 Tax=invertebrate metagenome TaxID=1711999 RepID=A0A2H9T5G5_9ZZZZ
MPDLSFQLEVPRCPDCPDVSCPFDPPAELLVSGLQSLMQQQGFEALAPILEHHFGSADDVLGDILAEHHRFDDKAFYHLMALIDETVDDYRQQITRF